MIDEPNEPEGPGENETEAEGGLAGLGEDFTASEEGGEDAADLGVTDDEASEADIAATLDAMIGGDDDSGAGGGSGFGSYTNMSALGQVPVEVQVVLGRARLPIGNILKLGRGAVVEIDRRVGEQVEIHINHRPVARGEIVIVDDDRLGVTLTEIITNAANLH
ncbi:MAG: flagellar motor switch protein FliN [Pseudomonadota bacterium]